MRARVFCKVAVAHSHVLIFLSSLYLFYYGFTSTFIELLRGRHGISSCAREI